MINKIIHITLALSIFLSIGGFWTSSHFCQDELTNTSFFAIFGGCCSSDAAPCSTDMEEMSCSQEEHKDDCCENEPSFHKLDQDQLLVKAEFKFFEQLGVFHFVVSPNHFQIPKIDKSHLKYYDYVPPLIVFDCQVQLQIFLC